LRSRHQQRNTRAKGCICGSSCDQRQSCAHPMQTSDEVLDTTKFGGLTCDSSSGKCSTSADSSRSDAIV